MQFTTFPVFCHQSISFHPEISKICISWRGRCISKFFEFFNFLDSFHTKLAKNDPQWQILPKKSVILAQNGQFWSLCRIFPIISHNSLSFLTFPIPFTSNWLKMTHNAKFSQKSGLDWLPMANSGHFAGFSL